MINYTAVMLGAGKYTRAMAIANLIDQFSGDRAMAEHYLQRTGIDPVALDDPTLLISARSLLNLCELVAAETGRQNFGLAWAQSQPDHVPLIGNLLLAGHFCDRVDEWVDLGVRLWAYHNNSYTMDIDRHSASKTASATLNVDLHPMPPRQWTERTMAMMARGLRAVTSLPDFNPVQMQFMHERPADTSLHTQVFKCPVEFDAEVNRITWHESVLELPTKGGLKAFQTLVSLFVRHRINKLHYFEQSFSVIVAQAVLSLSGSGLNSAEAVASGLGMTSKAMYRRLQEEGTSYTHILEQCREKLARQYLLETNAPISWVAGLLDYSSLSPFSVAFKKWTGKSPREFRNERPQ